MRGWCMRVVFGFSLTCGLTPQCQRQVDAWCNSPMENPSCLNAISAKNFSLPLYARYSGCNGSPTPQWRCYSPSSLTSDLSSYSSGTAYCTESDNLLSIIDSCGSHHTITVNASTLFSRNETKYCGQIRTPQPLARSSYTVWPALAI